MPVKKRSTEIAAAVVAQDQMTKKPDEEQVQSNRSSPPT